MEKTVFLFTRHTDRTREDFAEHYVSVHAVLGRTLTKSLKGYTVNLVKNSDWPDAVTEHWANMAYEIHTPSIGYETKADFEKVLVDDRTMFSDYELYIVGREEIVVDGALPAFAQGEPTPLVKAVWLYRNWADAPPPPPGALRVVDNHVIARRRATGDGWWSSAEPDYPLIRMAWANNVELLGDHAGDALIVTEYRQINPVALAGA